MSSHGRPFFEVNVFSSPSFHRIKPFLEVAAQIEPSGSTDKFRTLPLSPDGTATNWPLRYLPNPFRRRPIQMPPLGSAASAFASSSGGGEEISFVTLKSWTRSRPSPLPTTETQILWSVSSAIATITPTPLPSGLGTNRNRPLSYTASFPSTPTHNLLAWSSNSDVISSPGSPSREVILDKTFLRRTFKPPSFPIQTVPSRAASTEATPSVVN